LVDLGSLSCVPCKMMEPELEALRNEYGDKLIVEFIDVYKDHAATRQYGIRSIPTQVFLDPSGKELFRHVGYMSKIDILNKWRELGYDFTSR
ncbi:MAG TPA: thioredoxin, partial [Firmicutes bacterium]|nr:thioredoxin [Bacillota bacterium]